MLKEFINRARAFEVEAHSILSFHESAASRVISLQQSYDKLTGLSISQDNLFQDNLFREALKCVENGLFRAAHVMAWAAFMDFTQTKVAEDGFTKIKAIRPNWKFSNTDELREQIPDFQLIETFPLIKLSTRNQMKALHGLLNKRNECAHPSYYNPSLNETLGFVSELIQRVEMLSSKSL